jgi:hypothetical protein
MEKGEIMFISPKPTAPTEILGGCIAVWRNAWDGLEQTIKLIEDATQDKNNSIYWQVAKVGGTGPQRVQLDTRKNYVLDLFEAGQEDESLRVVHNNIYEMIWSCAKWYTDYFKIDPGFYINESFQVLKYTTGDEFKAHYDGNTSSRRVISPILYLNNNYEGGELEFVYHGIKIKPEAGDFYIFPANFAYAHIAHPVKEGTKYAVVTWLHDAPNS